MQRIHDDVEKYGWHVVAVTAAGSTDDIFAFTVGLYQTHQHPELVMTGLPMNVAHSVLSTCVSRIEEGKPFADGQVRDDVLNRFRAAIVVVDKRYYSEYLGSAIGFYDGTDFPALQVVWPDRNGHYPWDPACESGIAAAQPVLAVTAA